MNVWKTAFAILASILLVGTQSVFAFTEKSTAKSEMCGCCACKKVDCCVAQPASTPEPNPASPVRAESQNHSQLVAIVISLLLPADEISPSKIFFPQTAIPHLTAVPLYDWNCSYLI